MAYAAPNEDTVVVCGGLGDMSNAAELNGGGATKAVWDAGSPSDFINTNSGPITTDANAAFDYGNKTIAATGIGTGVTVGTLCYLDDGAAEASFFTGIYEVTTVAANLLTFANIELSGVDTDQANGVTCNVGGAIDTLEHVFDNPVNNAALYNRYIYINGIVSDNDGAITLTASVDFDVNAGSTTTQIIVVCYNSTLSAEGTIIITTAASLTNGLFYFFDKNFYYLQNFDFNGGGAGKADYCIRGAGQDYLICENCTFQNAPDVAAVYSDGDFWMLINCELKDSGAGFKAGGSDQSYARIIDCSVHDNTNDGIFLDNPNCQVTGCLVYDNGGYGLRITGGRALTIIIGNTFYVNDNDNVYIANDASHAVVLNNTSVGSTGGYGFNLNGNTGHDLSFGWNHSSVNSSGHYSEGADNTFAAWGLGNNKADTTAAADIFTNVSDGSEDFTPKSGTDLIDNALDVESAGELDIGAIQSAAGAGGGLLHHPGMTGGINA